MKACQHIVAPSTEGMADGIGGGAGPPGAGTPMLARRLTTMMPATALSNGIGTMHLHSVAGRTGETTPPSPSRTWAGLPL